MTTLDEISACPLKNYEFWTERAKLHLCLYFEHRGRNEQEAKLQKSNFRKDIKRRKEQEYLN